MSAAAAKTVAKAAAGAAGKAAGAAAGAAGKGKFPTPQRDLAAAMGYPSSAASLAAAAPLALGIAREAATLLTLRAAPIPMALHASSGLLTPGAPLPPRPPPGLGGRTLNKRLRLHPHWKLRPVRRWVDFAPLVKELSIRFDPAVEGFAGARELGRQARSSKAQAKFPNCAVSVLELDDGSLPMVVVKWVRGSSRRTQCGARWWAEAHSHTLPSSSLPLLPTGQ